MSVEIEENKRTAERRRSFKGAQISFGGLTAAIDCVVRNYSETGARLMVESQLGVPDRFELVREGAPKRKCHVVWRQGSELGVVFD
jgi:hypothetical protein